jgi:hypothetical protein
MLLSLSMGISLAVELGVAQGGPIDRLNLLPPQQLFAADQSPMVMSAMRVD